jgi:hypothetical protein
MQRYETDVIAWANEQAAFIRSGRFDLLDIEHIADEIEDVGKSEQRELESRMVVLLAHLLKWKYQPERRGNSWEATIRTQRTNILRRIKKTPSLKSSLTDIDWWGGVWDDALALAVQETQYALAAFPSSCPWDFDAIISDEFWPY